MSKCDDKKKISVNGKKIIELLDKCNLQIQSLKDLYEERGEFINGTITAMAVYEFNFKEIRKECE